MAFITVDSLAKSFGRTRALAGVSFAVRAGAVTGLLGPNGAGKTTTLRIVLGLVRPDAGSALVDGRPYAALQEPLRAVGAVGEDLRFHPARSGRDHLRVVAASVEEPAARVEEMLALVDLTSAARRPVGGYSLGMRQRLALAAALLPDPAALVLDEPMNGLDPHGVRWLRALLRAEADAGRAVLVSSHLLAEMAQLVDDVVVLDRGRVISEGRLEALLRGGVVEVWSERVEDLVAALRAAGITIERGGDGAILARGTTPELVGQVAADHGIALRGLTARTASLEDAFVSLTEAQS